MKTIIKHLTAAFVLPYFLVYATCLLSGFNFNPFHVFSDVGFYFFTGLWYVSAVITTLVIADNKSTSK